MILEEDTAGTSHLSTPPEGLMGVAGQERVDVPQSGTPRTGLHAQHMPAQLATLLDLILQLSSHFLSAQLVTVQPEEGGWLPSEPCPGHPASLLTRNPLVLSVL